jgi:hypothetical protein
MPMYLEPLIFSSIPSKPWTEEFAGTNLMLSLGEILIPKE